MIAVHRSVLVLIIMIGIAMIQFVVGGAPEPTHAVGIYLDPGFGAPNGFITDAITSTNYTSVAVSPVDGRITIAGVHSSNGSTPDKGLLRRRLSDGSNDPSFGINGDSALQQGGVEWPAMVLDAGEPDGVNLVGFGTNPNGFTYYPAVWRYRGDGSPDPGVGTNGVVKLAFCGVSPCTSGQIFGATPYRSAVSFCVGATPNPDEIAVAGYSDDRAGGQPDERASVAILNRSTLHVGRFFTETVGTGYQSYADSVVMQSDLNLVVGGWELPTASSVFEPFLIRFTPDGVADPTYGVAGATTFGVGQSAQIRDLAIQSNGMVIAGTVGFGPTSEVPYLVRLTKNGQLDPTFNGTGIVQLVPVHPAGSANVSGLFVQPWDQKILAVGNVATGGSGNYSAFVARVNADGSMDPTWGTNGIVIPNVSGSFIVDGSYLQTDGKILVAGYDSNGNGMVARVLNNSFPFRIFLPLSPK